MGNALRHCNESQAPGSRERDKSFPLIVICTPGRQTLSEVSPGGSSLRAPSYLSVAFVLVIKSPVTKGNSHGAWVQILVFPSPRFILGNNLISLSRVSLMKIRGGTRWISKSLPVLKHSWNKIKF